MSDPRRKLPVLRALAWKEWRQLRLLRLVGAGLCLALPPLLLAAAAASRRGLTFGPPSTSSSRDILVDAVPRVMLGAWGLLTLFVVAQCFVGDRAAGLEPFLLASPVRRRWVWCVRLAASAGSVLTIAVAGVLAWVLWAVPSAGWAAVTRSGGLALLFTGGALTIAVAAVGGIAAAALVPAPLPAVLAGLVLGLVPLGLATLMSGLFPFAAIRLVPVGGVLSLLLFPALAWASFRALCTGEPAGRGRYRRAGTVLAVAAGGIAVLFVTLAPIAASLAGGSPRYGQLTPCPTRALALITSGWPEQRGWLVDTSVGEVRHKFGLAIRAGSWSSDGRHLAVVSHSGPLGMRLPSARVEVYDAARMQPLRRFSGREFRLNEVSDVRWTATHLVLAGWDGAGRPRLGAARLADWRPAPLAVDPALLDARPWTLVGAGGTLFLAVRGETLGPVRSSRIGLRVLDVETGAVSPLRLEQDVEAGVVSGRLILHMDWRLSPSGRYWIASDQGSQADLRLLDVDTGKAVEFECTEIGRLTWLAGDELVWGDYDPQGSRLRAWDPTAGLRDLHTAEAPVRFHLQASPDGRKLLISEFNPRSDPESSLRHSARVYDAGTGGWSNIDRTVVPDRVGAWGGPDVLVSWTPEGLAYQHLD